MSDAYNILLLGSGGREHAMADHIVKSKRCANLFIAPGNGGTSKIGTNLPIEVVDIDAIKSVIKQHQIKMVIIGPEDPLDMGVVDALSNDPGMQDVMVFGPRQGGAKLESSKAFAKDFMLRAGIPTAAYRQFGKNDLNDALAYVGQHSCPVVIKADGLAAGKGVLICQTNEEAVRAVGEIFSGQFGTAGNVIVVESFLTGIEFSVFIAAKGREYVMLPVAKDYKKIFEQDRGPNTGGMGAVSPVPFVDDAMMDKTIKKIVLPTLQQLEKENIPYTGFIFFGLIAVEGAPYLIEYNVRMGDPETEVVFPLIKSDMVEVFEKLINELPVTPLMIDNQHAAGIYVVAEGYPGTYEKGIPIDVSKLPPDLTLYHGGTKYDNQGQLVSNGGRVMFVLGRGDTLTDARKKALSGADAIIMKNKYFRRDIGSDVDG